MKGSLIGLLLVASTACGGGSDNSVTAAGDEQRSANGKVQIRMTASDFGFDLDAGTYPAGPAEMTLVNNGVQPHQALVYRLNDGVDFTTFKQTVMEDDTQVPKLARGGTEGVSKVLGPGDEFTTRGYELRPGSYAVICWVRDQSGETSKNHAELGMIETFEVE